MAAPQFNELSPEEQAFISEKKIKGEKTVDEWLQFFEPLARFDRKSDLQRNYGNYIKAFWAFWIIYGIFKMLVYMYNHLELEYYIIPAGIILIFTGLLYMTDKYYQKFQTLDIPNLLRGFIVPFLEMLKKKFHGDAELELNVDLENIDKMIEVEAESRKTDKFNYFRAILNSSELGSLKLNIDARGVEQPFYSYYKLRHTAEVSREFDKSRFEATGINGSLDISDENGKLVVTAKFKEQSEFPIESDPGPLGSISEHLRAINKAIKQA